MFTSLILRAFKISEIKKGPWFLKNGLGTNTFIRTECDELSNNIAIYFLSTIVADHIASAIFFSLTKASPLYFHTLPWVLIA